MARMKPSEPSLSLHPGTAHSAARSLPPRPDVSGLSAEEAAARKAARDQRDAQVRGVSSVAEMREAIRAASAALPEVHEIARIGPQKTAAFRERARAGLPFIMSCSKGGKVRLPFIIGSVVFGFDSESGSV